MSKIEKFFKKQIGGLEIWTIGTIELFIGMASILVYGYTADIGLTIFVFLMISTTIWFSIFTTDTDTPLNEI